MASLSPFLIERHSRFWFLGLLKSPIKIAYPERSGMGETPMVTVFKKCQLLEGFLTRRKVAERSTQLSCLSNVTVSLSLFQNECPLKMLAVVASDLPKLSNKIAYPERNRMEKKLMVTV